MEEEKYKSLLRETWGHAKVGIALIISLIIVFGISLTFAWLTKEHEISLMPGFWLWILSFLSSIGFAILILFVIREYKVNHFWKWGESWKQKADESLKYLQTSEIINNKITIDSFGVIKEFNSVYEKCQEENNEVHELKFLGSMVGFSKFLPKHISNQYCKNENDLFIKIVASNVNLDSGKYRLGLYPSKFIISILSGALVKNAFIGELDFEIFHFSIDFPSALFVIGDYKSINTQSLVSKAWNIPDNTNFELIGTIYKDDSDTKDEFQRSKKSVEKIIDDYEKKPPYPIERWSLSKSNDTLKLSINNSVNWSIKSKSEIYCIVDKGYNPNEDSIDIVGIDNIKQFVENFKKKLINKGIH